MLDQHYFIGVEYFSKFQSKIPRSFFSRKDFDIDTFKERDFFEVGLDFVSVIGSIDDYIFNAVITEEFNGVINHGSVGNRHKDLFAIILNIGESKQKKTLGTS